MKKQIVTTENWAETLRNMQAGEKVVFPARSIMTIRTTISRLQIEMCLEGAHWMQEGRVDKTNGTFTIKRVA